MDRNLEKAIIRFFERDRFAQFVGIELIRVEPGFAAARMEITEKHLNGLNIVQGGAIYTLADFAFAAATNSNGLATVGINTSITYLKAPSGKFITAEAREISSGKKICGCDVNVTDEDGSIIAKFIGTGYRKNLAIDFIEGKVLPSATKPV
ncbi:acyl-coenzyme A thioesterase PaaI [Ruminiclostridium hungatei]|uniref:Acyl-coenzyme A thioesterase PaaI n=1 Tax=Ruminiclostridium hungatei TaxID=48256 RepID=A0A1V4SKE4_RUMHU|nr:PaaI family thioesterase [Ruminiclostridium hungatei]OPX43707.1 acyl-coenzyme A thioesterase PaaI [Ruminiclostridium hungatei]